MKRARPRVVQRLATAAAAWVGLLGSGCDPSETMAEEGIAVGESGAGTRTRYAFEWRADARRLDDDAAAKQRLDARLQAFAARVDADRQRLGRFQAPRFDGEPLHERIDAVLGRLGPGTRAGVHVRDLATDAVLFDHHGDELFNPASNHKILTSSAVIDLLGSDYRFETTIRWDGESLFVQGTGDPSLDPVILDDLAATIVERLADEGAPEILRIVIDDSAFSGARLAPGFAGFDGAGLGVSYQAPSGALSSNFNTIEIVVYPIAGTRRTAVKVVPPSTHVRVTNDSRRGAGRLMVSTRPGASLDGPITHVQVSGRAMKAETFRRRVVDPGLFTAGVLASALAERTDSLPPAVLRGPAPPDAPVIALHVSPEVLDAVGGVLAFSNNFVAEQLLRTLGWRMTGGPGDWDNGSEVLRGYWAALGNGPDQLEFENASGMSVMGRVTPAALVQVLAVGHRGQPPGRGLVDALPIAGVEGTVKHRLRSSARRVRAKTGTLDGVSGLTGFITSPEGRAEIAFSILINAESAAAGTYQERKRAEDAIVLAVLERLDEHLAERAD